MKKKQNTNFLEYFHLSIYTGTVYQLLYFGIELLSGYFLSILLESALSANIEAVLRYAAFLIGILLIVIPILYALSRQYRIYQQKDRQSFLSYLYSLLLENRLCIENSGALDVRLEKDTESITQYYSLTLPHAIGSGVTFLGSTILLFKENWRVGLLFSLLNFSQLLPPLVYEGWAKKIYAQTRSDEESYFNWLLEGSRGIQTLKAYKKEQWFLSRFTEFSRQITHTGKKAEQTATVENIVYEAVNTLLGYGTYLILGVFMLSNWVTIQQVPFFLVLSSCLFTSMEGFFNLKMCSYEVQCATKRLEPQERCSQTIEPMKSPMLLQAKDIHMKYGEKEVLCGVSLSIRSGEKILLSGINGSGKSTLIRILLGIEAPSQGNVVYAKSLMEQKMLIAFSSQEDLPMSFTGLEVADTLGKGEKIDAMALKEYLRRFDFTVSNLEIPLSQLSFGQRQKFYLSIALSGRAEFLILDEPTNHLDVESISFLSQCLRERKQTILVCCHDCALTVAWDRVLKMKEGIIN